MPPSHSGAAKRIFKFFEYLVNEGHNAKIITNSKVSRKNVYNIPFVTLEILRKIEIILQFLINFFCLFFLVFTISLKKDTKPVVWLLSANPLTFASVIIFKLFDFKIITQNTLVGSDDPEFEYPNDLLNLKYRLKHLQYKFSDVVICNSPALVEITSKYHSNVVLIPNPVDINDSEVVNNYSKTVLVIGRVSYRKGSDILFKTINYVHQLDDTIIFSIVGPYEDMDQPLKVLYNSLESIKRENVNFHGFIENPIGFYNESSIFFFPSRREGFPSVIIEAMSNGLPVICKKLVGITNFILGNDYEFEFDTEDHRVFGEAILSLLSDKKSYNEIVISNRSRVEIFSKSKIYKEYMNIINSFK
jgi:glycosyltransferase involved in cell wall biosynthesis